MTENPYASPDPKHSDGSSAAEQLSASMRQAVWFLAIASAALAAWYLLQAGGVSWLWFSGFFSQPLGGLTTTDLVSIVLSRLLWPAILGVLHIGITIRLRAYALALHDASTNPDLPASATETAQLEAWRAIALWVLVIAGWKTVMFVIYGLFFNAWRG